MFHKILVNDWETTGVPEGDDCTRGAQGIQYGAVVLRATDLAIIDDITIDIRFEGLYGGSGAFPDLTWSEEAEKIHGLSREHLAVNGLSIPGAARVLETFVRKHWAPDEKILTAGHNPGFDRFFTEQLMELGGRAETFMFHHRMIDTFSLGYMLLGTEDSNQLFDKVGISRAHHNAYEDAHACVSVLRHIRKIRAAAEEMATLIYARRIEQEDRK